MGLELGWGFDVRIYELMLIQNSGGGVYDS